MASNNSPSSISIFPVLLVNFIGMLGYSVVVPILVFLVEKFGGNGFIYGLLGSIYPAFQLLGAPVLGRWSDQVGRKRILLLSQAGTLLAWLIFALALLLPHTQLAVMDTALTGSFALTLPLLMLFLARALDGLTGGNVSVANAYLSDISTDQNRKANFGKMASSTSLGFVLGPALAGLLAGTVYGELVPVLTAALISLGAIFVIQRLLPESKQELVQANLRDFKLSKLFQIEHKECYQMENCPATGLRAVLQQPNIPLLFGIYFLTFLSFSFFYACFPVYASQMLAWNSFELGVYLTVSSLIMVVVQGPVLSYLSARVSDANLVIFGALLIGVNFLLLPLGSIPGVYAANVLMSVGNGLMWPSFLAILSKTGDRKIQGTIQGYASSTGSLASIFGLLLGGVLFGYVGPDIFRVAAVVMFAIFLTGFVLRKSVS